MHDKPNEPSGYAIAPHALVRDPDVPPAAKVIYMVLASHTGKHGTWWISHQQLAQESGLSVSTVRRYLSVLRELGWVSWEERRSEKGDRLPHSYRIAVLVPEPADGAPPHQVHGTLPPTPRDPSVTVVEGSGASERSVGRTQGEPRGNPIQSDPAPQGSLIPLPSSHHPSPAALEEEFHTWWKAYPRREGKHDARRAYGKARRDTPMQVLLDGAHRLAASGRDPQFIPHAATWLNGRRWEDEPVEQGPPTDRQALILREELRRAQEADARRGRTP